MREIIDLCEAYKRHLGVYSYQRDQADRVWSCKLLIIDQLLLRPNPDDVLHLLEKPTDFLRYPSSLGYTRLLRYQDILKIRRSSWIRDVGIGVVLLLTFPVSVPLLIFYSWSMRGDINFFKPDGEIFLEKLLLICEPRIRQQHEETLLLPKVTTTQLRSEGMNDYKSLELTSPMQNQALEEPDDISLFPADFHLSDTGRVELKSFRMRFFPQSEKETLGIDLYVGFRFVPELTKATSFKLYLDIRPSYLRKQLTESISNMSANISTETTSQPTSVFENIRQYWFKPNPGTTFETVYADPTQGGRSFSSKGYRKALDLARNDNQRILALEGLINGLKHEYDMHCASEAQANSSIVYCERRINELNYFRQHGRPLLPDGEWDKVPSYSAENTLMLKNYHDECVRLIKEDDDYRLRKGISFQEEELQKEIFWSQKHASLRETTLDDISKALNALPETYHSMTLSANQLQRQCNLIFVMLKNNQIGEAELLYRRIRNVSYFIESAFPYLKALLFQLSGIFHLVSEPGYDMVSTSQEPTDENLVEQTLYIYPKEKQLWAATRRADMQVERFRIETNKLGRYAENIIRSYENHNYHGIYDDPEDTIMRALADYGYYYIHWPTVLSAAERFEEAYKIVLTYDAELAERVREATLGPLKSLIAIGQEAKNTTPLNVQRKMIKEHLRNNAIKRKTWEKSPQPSQLSDEEWNELLGDNVASQYSAKIF